MSALVVVSPEDLEAMIARALRRALDDGSEAGLVSQSTSPLGSRRHCNAVKRRLANGLPGAAKVGRKYLLTQGALADELATTSAATAAGVGVPSGTELRRKLGLL